MVTITLAFVETVNLNTSKLVNLKSFQGITEIFSRSENDPSKYYPQKLSLRWSHHDEIRRLCIFAIDNFEDSPAQMKEVSFTSRNRET